MNAHVVDDKIVLPEMVRLTLQRAFQDQFYPDTDRPPRSYGRMPILQLGDPRRPVFASGGRHGEVLWLGIESIKPEQEVTVTLHGPRGWQGICPPAYCIKGWDDGGLWSPFGGNPSEEATLLISAAVMRPLKVKYTIDIRIMTNDKFTELGGRKTKPLDPADGYADWLLP